MLLRLRGFKSHARGYKQATSETACQPVAALPGTFWRHGRGSRARPWHLSKLGLALET